MNNVTPNLVSAHVLLSSEVIQSERTENTGVQFCDFERCWEVESTGNLTHATEFNIKEFLNKVSWNKERNTVPLPWKPEISEILPDNYSIV